MIMHISEKGKKQCNKLLQKMKKTEVYGLFYENFTSKPYSQIHLFMLPNFILLDKVKTKMEEKYFCYSVEEFITDLKAPFRIMSDFLLSDDYYQIKCKQYVDEIQEFKNLLNDNYLLGKRSRICQVEDPGNSKVKKYKRKQISGFLQKIQAVYYLKSLQHCPNLIEDIGRQFNILTETEGQIILKFEANPGKEEKWKQMLRRQ